MRWLIAFALVFLLGVAATLFLLAVNVLNMVGLTEISSALQSVSQQPLIGQVVVLVVGVIVMAAIIAFIEGVLHRGSNHMRRH